MRVIIIGGVAAGMSAAAKLKRIKPEYEVVVYEKTEIVSFGACGLPYFVGGFFNDADELLARTPEKLREAGIDLNIFREVVEVDSESKKIKVKNIKTDEIYEDYYDKLMIATGARSIMPPIKNIKLKNVSTLKSLDVDVIQLEDRILPQVFDKEMTDVLEEEINRHNVNLHLDEMVVELCGEDKVEKVITNKGEIDTDVVIIATGVRPNTEFLSNTNIKMLKNGAIVVDEYGRTSVEDIYSAGDCATIKNIVSNENVYVPLATGANKLGRIVGENLAGREVSYQGSLSSSCIKIMDMEAASTGITEKQAKDLGINVKSKFISDYNQTHYYPGRNKIYVKLIYDADTKVILGGQVAGFKDAVQRANVLAAAIFGKMTTNQLGMLDLCYAPPFARTWDVLNVAGNVSK